MQDKDLKKTIEALLFVTEKPITLKQIAEVCGGIEYSKIKSAIKVLKEEYNKEEKGIQINEVAGGLQFSTHPDCAEYLKKLYKTKRVFRLSASALETLAIIAYKQPVTRPEIEFIRGVNVDGVIKTLEERDLISEKGRKEVPGRPILYGTTEEFLHYFGLKSLEQLPSLEEYSALEMEEAVYKDSSQDRHASMTQQEQAAFRKIALRQHIDKGTGREAEDVKNEEKKGEIKNGQDEHSEVKKSD